MHKGLEEGGVVGPRGCVRGRVLGSSSGALQFDPGSCGGEGLGEMAVCLLKGGAGVADGDGYELHLAPKRLELVDEGAYLAVFSWRRLSHPKSWQKPISMMIRLHCLRSKVVGSSAGVFGTPLA